MGKDLRGKELGTGLSQRKDGRYQARFTRYNGNRAEKNFIKLSEAKSWLNEQRHMDNMLFNGDITVDEWYEYWISNLKSGIVKDNTVRNYKNRYKTNIRNKIGNLKLVDVRQLHCQEVLNDMFDEYANGSIKLTRITMYDLFQCAVDNNYIFKNPANGLKEKLHDGNLEPRVLTRDEQDVFKKYVQHSVHSNAFLLVLETGLRSGEVGGLMWDDIDFENKFLYVKRTMLYCIKEKGFSTDTPKTKSSKRKIPLTQEAIRILNEQKITQKKLRLNCKKWHDEWDGLVFTTRTGMPVISTSFVDSIDRIVNAINMDRRCNSEDGTYDEFERMVMHTLRHTFATRAIENGVEPKVLQKILGHASLATTMNLYVHVTDEKSTLEMMKMENY